MSSDTNIAEVYNGIVVQLETLLRSRFDDITWDLGRYSELDAQSKVEHLPNGNQRITGIIVTGTANDGKHQSSFIPIDFTPEGYSTIENLDETVIALAEQLRIPLLEPAS
ncbi:hypothetical protein [Herpetosiphon giganteus]|uniref:hypothetical protein n=1 Tax=Herpetosiphon giganteus TaxID=2029754 RepID=UPI00195B2E95|nr:hypothetical protein [Herpetosiphon giganteus]MBM7843436.1 hypothetical protein [Herpetosiphon giganteus]